MTKKAAVLVPKWEEDEPFFRFGKRYKQAWKPPTANSPYRVAPDDKRQPVHEVAASHNMLLDVYADGIALGRSGRAEKFVLGVFFGVMCVPFVGILIYMAYLAYDVSVLFAFFILLFSFLFFLFSAFFFRGAFCMYHDGAVLFDRKSRQVSFIPIDLPPFFLFWKNPKTNPVKTIPWDDLKIRCYRHLQSPGAGQSVRLVCDLCILWGKENDPHDFDGYERIGEQGWWGDNELWSVWEHVRRYMEEDGPAIRPGEKLRKHTKRMAEIPQHLLDKVGGKPLSPAEIAELTSETK